MKYFYTNNFGHTIELEISEEYSDELYFIEKAEVALIEPSYVVDQIVNEISMSGEGLLYCIAVSYDNIDYDYERWELNGEFSTEDATRFMNYINLVVDEVQEEGDTTDSFYDQKHITLPEALELLNYR